MSRCILVIWRTDLAYFFLLERSSQCVVGELKILNKGLWVVSIVYGKKDLYGRRKLWDCLELHSRLEVPSVVRGDFNCMLPKDDKKGGKKFSFSQGLLEMKAFMNNNDLHDVGILGPKYTWCNNKNGNARILERLDRCLLNYKALEMVHQASIRHLARVASDHCPIVLKNFNQSYCSNRFLRFEDVWLSYLAVATVVSKSWNKLACGDVMEFFNKKFFRVMKSLHFLSKSKHKNLVDLKEKLKREIEEH
ncbi:uncharacterized protein LOC110097132 [Dendrobium catenatum]|uniref:uncharacterized protein LOC110097132 n=1 Tax=Dendrobium catenatum TaxID=906689 RepID=UPI00109F3570|nr:uncharacterized protein LOC110097132 [Dendrobium catenatum]